MNRVFRTTKTFTFREADPAGIMFFGNIFGVAHDAFEQFILDAGFTWQEWFLTKDYLIPIRHTEADYKAPFRPGQTYEVLVSVASFGETSFKMRYVFESQGHKHATVQMVHSVLDKKTQQKLTIPADIKSRLQPYLESLT